MDAGYHQQQHAGGYAGYDNGPGARGGFRGNAANAKTKLCQRWATGDCRFGDRCNFAHGEHELRALPARMGPYGRGGGYGDDGQHNGPPGGAEDVYARQGFPVQGPNGWVAYRTQDTGEVYYHNHNTAATQWDRPAEWPSAP